MIHDASGQVKGFLAQAVAHYQAGRIQEARQQLQDLLVRDPERAEACHLLGIIHAQNSDFSVAEPLLARAVHLAKHHADYLNSYGNVLDALGRHDEAIRAFQKAIKRRKRYAEAYNNMGVACQHSGAETAAVAAFRAAIRRNPKYPEAFCNLGNIYTQMGRYEDAVTAYQGALRQAPNYLKAVNNLGIAYLEGGHDAEACEQFDHGLTLLPDQLDMLVNRGIARFNQRQYQTAFDDFIRVLELDPTHINACCNLGKVCYECGAFDAAIARFLKVLEGTPKHLESIYGLARICFSQGMSADFWTFSQAALDAAGAQLAEHIEIVMDQAIMAWIEGRPDQCRDLLSEYAPMLTATRVMHHQNRHYIHAYYQYLSALTRYRERHPEIYAGGGAPVTFLLGDSHVLAGNGVCLEGRSRLISRLIPGCKVWHIAQAQDNRFKAALTEAIAALPETCDAVLMLGEIDCRPNEGIIPFLDRHPCGLDAYMPGLIGPYVEYILKLTGPRSIRATFSGVPYPGYLPGSLSAAQQDRLIAVIACFNQTLEDIACSAGCRFVDVYASTRDRQGHLDEYHLQPACLAGLIGGQEAQ